MALAREERVYEKYAWVILFAIGIVLLFFGSPDIFRPVSPTSSPEAVLHIRLYGIAVTGLGVFGLAIILKSFRRGEKWAWFALWYYPVFFLSLSVFVQTIQDPQSFGTRGALIAIMFAIISLAGLLLPYRKFFPRK